MRYFSQFLDLYGRPFRHAVPERDASPSLTQALHIYAGETYTEKISKPGGRLGQLLEKGTADLPLIQELYLAALTRFPEEREQSAFFGCAGAGGGVGPKAGPGRSDVGPVDLARVQLPTLVPCNLCV